MDLRSDLEYLLFRGALTGLRILPHPWCEGLLTAAARRGGFRLERRRRLVREQLRAVFPDLSAAEVVSLADRVYAHLGRTAAEVFCPRAGAGPQCVDVEPGWEAVDAALAEGRGAIVASGHLGNFELGGEVLAERYRLLDVVKPQRNRRFDRYLEARRRQRGITTVPMDEAAPAVLRHLRGGGLVSLLVDQDAGRSGVRIPFLGLPASTWTGAARIAVRTGCPVIPMAIVRRQHGRHLLRIAPVIRPGGGDRRPEAVRDLTARISAAVEAFILDDPEQWFWVHRRWKGESEVRSDGPVG